MSGLDNWYLRDCLKIAEPVFDAVLHCIGNEVDMKGREGGYLCIADRTGVPALIGAMGTMPEEKRRQYLRNAREKAERLSYTARWAGHTLSRQSRDEKRERWIGAAVGKEAIVSFSGFYEDADELFSVLLLKAYGDLSLVLARDYLRKNKYYNKVRHLIDSPARSR